MIPKFRAWLKEENKMIEPSNILSISFKLCEMTPNYLHGFEKEKYDFYDLELMQSTGLFDKNGKEIFEGDILTNGIDVMSIKRHDTLGFYIDFKGKIDFIADGADLEEFEEDAKEIADIIEIIGNIYENPELLEVE